MRVFLRVLVLMMAVFPAWAQQELKIVPADDPPVPLTKKQAQEIALEKIPGKVINSQTRSPAGVIYDFRIKTQEGTVATVAIDQGSGEIIDIVYTRLKGSAHLPEPEITAQEAEAVARAYVEEKKPMPAGYAAAKVSSSSYDLYQKKPAYVVKVEKHMSYFTVYIDPMTGEVIAME